MTLSPPITPPQQTDTALRGQGFAVLDAAGLAQLAGVERAAFDTLAPYWNHLPPDQHLRDGGRYRRRRHSCFTCARWPCAMGSWAP